MRRHLPVLLAVLTALVLAACGGGDQPGTGDTSAPAQGTTQEGQDQAAAGDAQVTIESFTFMPEKLEVSAGSEVTWTNQDGFAHTATSGTPGDTTDRFDGVMGELGERTGKGETFSFTFEEPGTYEYFCRFHPQQMRATVTVTE